MLFTLSGTSELLRSKCRVTHLVSLEEIGNISEDYWCRGNIKITSAIYIHRLFSMVVGLLELKLAEV